MLLPLQEENIRGLGGVSQKWHSCKYERKSKNCRVPPRREESSRGSPASPHRNKINRKRRPEKSIFFPLKVHVCEFRANLDPSFQLPCFELISEPALAVLLHCMFLWWIEYCLIYSLRTWIVEWQECVSSIVAPWFHLEPLDDTEIKMTPPFWKESGSVCAFPHMKPVQCYHADNTFIPWWHSFVSPILWHSFPYCSLLRTLLLLCWEQSSIYRSM